MARDKRISLIINPETYYQKQYLNHLKVQDMCLILKHLQLQAAFHPELPPEQLSKKYDRFCFNDDACRSPEAEDYILMRPDKNRLVRLMPNKTLCTRDGLSSKVLSDAGDNLVIAWDEKSPETHTCAHNICMPKAE